MSERTPMSLRILKRWPFLLTLEVVFTAFIFIGHNLFLAISMAFWFNVVLFILLPLLAGIDLIRYRFQHRSVNLLFLTSSIIISIISYATLIEPWSFEVRELHIPSEKVTTSLRILHISDIQSAKIGSYEKAVFENIAELKPDLLIHTGDLIHVQDYNRELEELDKLSDLFATIQPRYGKYHVVGDTDGRLRPFSFQSFSGVKTLLNEGVSLNHEGSNINLFGLELINSRLGPRSLIKAWTDTVSSSDLNILVGHSPDFVQHLPSQKPDLCLAGHTHGGQIRLPFIGPLITLSRLPREQAMGHHMINGSQLHISAGIGAEHVMGLPSIRFNCPPEMTLITLTPVP